MARKTHVVIWLIFIVGGMMTAQVEDKMSDRMETEKNAILIELLGHASLRFQIEERVIYVDPTMEFFHQKDFGRVDLILVTHNHSDHFQADLIEKLKSPAALVILAKNCQSKLANARVMNNGDRLAVEELLVEAVPAYNIKHRRENGEPFHSRGEGNGYVISYGGRRIYIAGDTECIPEMKAISGVDAAFLPANLPYTMDVAMFMSAVDLLHPKIVYPYHYKFGQSILTELLPLLTEKKIVFGVPKK